VPHEFSDYSKGRVIIAKQVPHEFLDYSKGCQNRCQNRCHTSFQITQKAVPK
jgi:hypothetical protein